MKIKYLVFTSTTLFFALINTAFSQSNCPLLGWSYYKTITIDNSANSSAAIQFQKKIIIDTQTPISQGKMLPSCADLRFQSSSCDNLPYWIENGNNTANTTIWIKLENIAANSIDSVFMYYGNNSALPQTNGDSTFVVFDNFDDNVINPDWSIITGNWSENNGIIESSGNGTYNYPTLSRINVGSLSDFYVQYNFKWSVAPYSTAGAWHGIQFNSNPYVSTDMRSSSEYYLSSTNGTLINSNWAADINWHKQVITKSNNYWSVYLDTNFIGNANSSINNLDSIFLRGPSNGWGFNSNVAIDNFFIALHSSSAIPINISNEMPIVICANNLVISPQTNSLSVGSTASFSATTSDPNPFYIWQSDLGQGFQTLNNFGNYSGVNTASLNIANVQLSEHNQPIRVITTSGNCIDTSNVAVINIIDTCVTNITIYDTLLTTVTDTLVINATITGINPPNNLNTLKVFPNPANTHITIDYGNFNAMSGYTLTIVNSVGQTVFTSPINQQTSYIDLSTWTGNGIYFVQLIDPQNNTIENRKIVIQ